MVRRAVLAGVGVVGAGVWGGARAGGGTTGPRPTAMLRSNGQGSDTPYVPQGWEQRSQLGAIPNDPRIGGQQ